MNRSTRRLLALAVGLVAFIILTALLYQIGMLKLEGQHRSFWRSLEWATETISTTGYGSDNQWSHPMMVILVVLMQFAGILLVPVIVSAFLVPFMEERFEQLLPNHRTVILPGAGHFVQEDSPDEIARALRTWWDDCVAPLEPEPRAAA